MAQNRAQDQLVEAIYQAATGERPWIDTVVSIANELGGIAGVLYDREVAGRLGRISLNASFGYSASAQTAFLSHYRSIDVRVPMALQ